MCQFWFIGYYPVIDKPVIRENRACLIVLTGSEYLQFGITSSLGIPAVAQRQKAIILILSFS